MKKLYVSNATGSVRMFNSQLDGSFVQGAFFHVPLFIYIPVIGFMTWRAFDAGISIGILFVTSWPQVLAVWTATEYVLHRFVFHFEPSSEWGKRIHFIFHGVHHDYPERCQTPGHAPFRQCPAGYRVLFPVLPVVGEYGVPVFFLQWLYCRLPGL
jgi:hypothetical protein